MNRSKTVLCLLLCIVVFPSVGRPQTSNKRDIPVIKLLKEYDDAWNRKDVRTVDSLLAENYVYFSSTGGTTRRKDTLEFLGSPKYILTSAERTEIVAYISETAIILSSRWKGNGLYNEKVFNDDQRCGLVFVRENKKWKLFSEHCTQITP